MKKISIITPSFNQGQYIEQTIDSVLSQQYPNLEYIIIDGGSTDNSVEIIKKFQKHLHFWISEKDNGQSAAINKGIQKASGDIINWLNSDDYYEPNALHKVNQYFEDDTTLVVGGRSNIWKENKIIKQSGGTDLYTTPEKTIGWARIDQPETFFRKSAIDQIGLLNEQLHYVMDREWWMRFLFCFGLNSIRKVDDILVNFRIHENSKTYSGSDDFTNETMSVFYTLADYYHLQEAALFSEKLQAKRIEHHPYSFNPDKLLIRKAVHYFWYHQVCIYYAENNYPKAKKFLSLIDFDLLQEEDQKHLRNIKNRIYFLPVFLKKILNNR